MSDSQARPSSAELAQRAQLVVDEAVQRHRQLLAMAQQFGVAQKDWHAMAAARLQEQQRIAQTQAECQVADIRARAAQSETAIAQDLHAQAQRIASGALALGWDSRDWVRQSPDAQPKSVSWIRIGSIPLQHQPVTQPPIPALVPLLNHAGWSVGAGAPEFSTLVQSVLLRLFATIPLHRIQVTIFDPALELQTGLFAPIREASPDTLPRAITQTDRLKDALDAVVQAMVRTTDDLSNLGVTNVEDHWRTLGSLDLTYRLIIVNSYPRGMTKAVDESLRQIAQMGGTRGASIIVRRDPSAPPPSDVDRRGLTDLLTAMEVTSTVVSVSSLPNTIVANDGGPERILAESVVARVADESTSKGLPALPLADVLAKIPDQWSDAEPDGLRAAFGQEKRRLLQLRLWAESPAIPHALIGGATGQGKSNLLLAVIHALAVRYRPDDLRMYLLDFKEGVELSSLGPSEGNPTWLPHAEVLGLESDREFGLSVLQHLVAQFAARSVIFRAAGVKDIVEFRRSGKGVMPRILLIIDEFQVLMDGDDETARQAVESLQQLAQKGRSYGIHLMLASQTTSGIRGLATKGDAIFSQFANRMSLKNTSAESQAILGQGNKAAALLTYRGEVILNENFGDPEHNRVGIVAHADDHHLRDLRRDLWERSHGKPPLVFFGSRPAPWDAAAVDALVDTRLHGSGDSFRAWVARPISVDSDPITVPISREGDQSVLVVGPAEAEAAGILSSMMASVAVRASRPTRWIVLDGSGAPSEEPEGAVAEWLQSVMALARGLNHEVEYVPRGQVRDFLLQRVPDLIAERKEADPDVFVFLIAPQRVPDIEVPATDEYGVMAFPKDMLQRLVREGSPRGVYLVGWWLNMRTAVAHLNYQTPGVGAHVLFGLARDEMQGLLDPRQPLPQGHPRVIVKDPRSRSEVRIGIPFERLTVSAVESIREAM